MCFSLAWVEQMLIWLVVLCAVVALLRLVIGVVLPQLGIGGPIFAIIVSAINIFIWAICLIAVIMFVFDLISCLAPMGIPRLH